MPPVPAPGLADSRDSARRPRAPRPGAFALLPMYLEEPPPARCRGGDDAAFVKIVARYEPKLLRYAARMLGRRQPDAAHDVVQDVFLRLDEWIARCRPPWTSTAGSHRQRRRRSRWKRRKVFESSSATSSRCLRAAGQRWSA